MRDEIIEILEMISPGISVENNYLNLVEYLESMEMIEENFENIESIMEMIVKLQ